MRQEPRSFAALRMTLPNLVVKLIIGMCLVSQYYKSDGSIASVICG
jgi:hypothetical protein